jgi:hypothetical protein
VSDECLREQEATPRPPALDSMPLQELQRTAPRVQMTNSSATSSSAFRRHSWSRLYVHLGNLLREQHGFDEPVSQNYLKMLREEAKQCVLEEHRSIWDHKLWR